MTERGRQSDMTLKLSHDRKVSPTGVHQGKWRNRPERWVPTMPNSFGLPAGTSCPGKTAFCVSCYADAAEGMQGVKELVTHNYRLLQQANSVPRMAALLGEMLGRFRKEFDLRLAQGRVEEKDRLFRWHWDGDWYSPGYALASRAAMETNPDVRFWAYTRSFRPPVDVVPLLHDVPNLALYLSVDAENRDAAIAQIERFPNVMLALCAEDYASARMLHKDRAPIVCPENAGRMALMTDGVGACVACRLCPDARRDVMFSTTHREVATVEVALVIKADRPLRVGERHCKNDACTSILLPSGGRGRPREYCSDTCRWQASRQRVGV